MSSCRSSTFHRTANCVLTVCVSQGGKRISALSCRQLTAQPPDLKSVTETLTVFSGIAHQIRGGIHEKDTFVQGVAVRPDSGSSRVHHQLFRRRNPGHKSAGHHPQLERGRREHLFGYTAEEAIGKPISLLTPPESPTATEEILRKILQGQRVEHYETTRLRKGGRVIAVSVTLSAIRDETKEIAGVSTIARHITLGLNLAAVSKCRAGQFVITLTDI